jgi:hypothetical protein
MKITLAQIFQFQIGLVFGAKAVLIMGSAIHVAKGNESGKENEKF